MLLLTKLLKHFLLHWVSTHNDLYQGPCHSVITRMLLFIGAKNLPISTEEVKKVCYSCRTCAELKPKFFHMENGTLIKATRSLERLSIDFKGPVPSISNNVHILTIMDEYFRFPFAFPCSNRHTSTILKCLDQLFALTGLYTLGYRYLLSYLSYIPQTRRVWHKAFLSWVRGYDRSPDTPRGTKNAVSPVGIPLKRGASGDKPSPFKEG